MRFLKQKDESSENTNLKLFEGSVEVKLNKKGLPILPSDLDDHDDDVWNKYLTKEEKEKYL